MQKGLTLDLSNNMGTDRIVGQKVEQLARAGRSALNRMQPRYDAFLAHKAPMLESIPNFIMSDFIVGSAYTRAVAQEILLLLVDHGFRDG